nr:retrotransposon protein, putative, Ty1-copia subclass [Tanacetum cinerariifolium]
MRGSLAVLNFPVEMVKESLKKMKYGFEKGCSPVVVLKKRHSQKNKKDDHKVVLEDLGADYLEQLLDSTNTHCAHLSRKPSERLLVLQLEKTLLRTQGIMIVLSIKDKLNYLEQPIPSAPVVPAGQHVAPKILVAHTAWIKGSKEIAGLMLMTMEPDIQRNLETLHAHEMLLELKTLFSQQAEHELLHTTRDSHSCKQEEVHSVSSLGKTINELHAMLTLHEQTLSRHNAPALHTIRAGKVQKVNKQKKSQPQMDDRRLEEELSLVLSRVAEEQKERSFGSWWTSRKLKLGALSLYVGNGQREAVEEVENQLGKTIKSLRSDCGGEYTSLDFLDHIKDHGIIAHRIPPYTPQHNGVSKRRNRTLLYMVRSMMSQITLSKSFWDYALKTATRILNMVPAKKVKKTPYEVWHGQVPKLSYLTVWGYQKETMRYSFYYPPKNNTLVARNAEFLENSLITQKTSGSLEELEIIQEEDTHPSIDTRLNHGEDDLEIDEPQSDIVLICRSTRTRHALDHMCLYIDAEEHKLRDLGERANYTAALLDPESEKWLNAMNVEMQSMKDNEVWVLVELPPNGKTVGSKWLFKKKTEMDGVVHTYKARLVEKGYTQTTGIDYEEIFSLVADIRAIRILIAITAYYDYEIWQMDVKTAFLNGYLNEEVYMEQPEGFFNPKYPNRVCKLKRSIYGLKQASRQWNKRSDDEIKKFGFTQNRDEPYVYLKASESNITFLILYVDDILIMGNNIPMLQGVKSYLGRCFTMKDLGEAAYILGIKIYKDRSRWLIGLCQSAYIEKILKRYCMENSKRRTVGSIMYAMKCTRPDVAFAQNTGYVFILNGGAVDWKSAKQSIFATSSAEAEYIAAFDASKEPVWVRKFIYGLGVIPTIKEPISMYCDNTRAIDIANESGITKGTRHFRAKVHYLHEVIEYGDVKLEKVHIDDNLADPFTKALAFPKYSEHTRNIGMLPASSLM